MRLLFTLLLAAPLGAQDRPNILWITSEDNGPHLGCYGDPDAHTPNLDALAARGMRYERCWSNAPVCAPARTTLITGMHATSLGAEHMRSNVRLPADVRLFPAYLRDAGYYCTNRAKEDYNVSKTDDVWDASNHKAHWRNRAPGQPFFAVVNLTTTHESQIRRRPHKQERNPETVRVPAYHPDDPIVRKDWAQYHDKISAMDAQVGNWLSQLDEDGLRETTIVFYFADHGSGMPRCKRWPYNSGLQVPLILHVPDVLLALAPRLYKPGAISQRLVSFVDLAPTVLSLAGIEAPSHMQGAAFAGEHIKKEPPFLYGYRGRMDERIDLVRSITDGRYVYIRNFMPHRIQGAYLDYMFQTPTTRRWKELYDNELLTGLGQRAFWESKPPEELYDLRFDRDEVDNLLLATKEPPTELRKLRNALEIHMIQTRDLGLLPENEVHRRAQGGAPRDIEEYPLRDLIKATSMGSSQVGDWLEHNDPAIRTWSAIGLSQTTEENLAPWMDVLRTKLADEVPSVRIAAAETLAHHGSWKDARLARDILIEFADLKHSGLYDAMAALNALDALDELSSDDIKRIGKLPRKDAKVPKRLANYVPRLIEHLLERHPPPRSRHVYKTVNDINLALHVHSPAGRAPEQGWPAVVLFHGGGWTGGDASQFFDQCEHLARHGLVAISAEYRLGKKHKATPDQCVADGKSAIRWVRAHAIEFGIRPDAILAGGGSAGGQIAAAVATTENFDDEPESKISCRPAALILFNPVFDNGPDGWGHNRVREYWESFSPLHNVSAATPPSLVMLGTNDSLVPVETAQVWKKKVEGFGGYCALKLYEDQEHGFFNRNRNEQMYEATVADMNAFLESLGFL